MPDTKKREEIEAAITQALLTEWDPLGVRDQPGEHAEYTRYAHDIYGLLARGGSDVQVGRLLHQIEREEMGHPDADHRDLSVVLHSLRVLERKI